MNQRQIEVFHAVMVHHTASRAAEVLFMSQPAVSKTIQQLERSIGFALFDRVKGRMLPTPEGLLLHQEVSQSFVGMAQLKNAASRIRDFGSGKLRIASLSALSTSIVPLALKAFQEQHPNVAITYQARLSSEVRDLVASGQFDMGLAADEVDTTGVDAVPYCRFRAVIAIPPGHPFARLSKVRPKDLNGVSFIALAPEDTTRQEADGIIRAHGAEPRVVLETPFSTTVCSMVLAGLGCGLVNPLTAGDYTARGLILKPFSVPVHFRTLMLFPSSRRQSRIVRDCVSAFNNVTKHPAVQFN
ncbi:LysR family transcriptional regulator [Allopusillimonas ginsengisoli]|nr:LysR family transcriptional regulator [Allopusillimonas ginsengisoli]